MTAIRKPHDDLKSLGLMVICITLNFVLSQVIGLLGLPLYFDCIGTILAAAVGGFLPGVVVGFVTNILIFFFNTRILNNPDDVTLYYCVVSVLIALVAAHMGSLRQHAG